MRRRTRPERAKLFDDVTRLLVLVITIAFVAGIPWLTRLDPLIKF